MSFLVLVAGLSWCPLLGTCLVPRTILFSPGHPTTSLTLSFAPELDSDGTVLIVGGGDSAFWDVKAEKCCISSQGWREPPTEEGWLVIARLPAPPPHLAAVLRISAGEGAWQINPPNAQKSLLPNSILQPAISAYHWLVQAKTKHKPSSRSCGIRLENLQLFETLQICTSQSYQMN